MHVHLLAGHLDRRAGSHVYHRELATRLAARGHRVTVVGFENDSELSAICEVKSVGPLPGPLPLLWRYHTWFKHRHCRRRLRAMRLDRPDVIVAGEHLFLPDYPRQLAGVPWIYLPHSLILSHEIDGYQMVPAVRDAALGMYRRIQRWSLEHADRTLRFTEYGCRVLAEDHDQIVKPRFVVNPIGIDVPPSAPPGEPGVAPRLLSVGSLNKNKRVDVAIRTLGELGSAPWEFDVVGDGPMRKELEGLAAELGVSDRVRFHGHQDDPISFYQNADLFLLTSCTESLGIVVIEAMSHGVPVIAMRADGKDFFNPNEELIEDDVDGFLANSDAHLRKRLIQLLADTATLRSIGAEARRKVEERFTWDRHLENYESLFETLISEHSDR